MAAKQSTATKRLAAPSRGAARVTVRMFCQGLGDCFLITIPQKAGRKYSILIDCGVAMGTASETQIMKQVVHTIAGLTKGRVDLLVVTHEHRDHVSGFVQARDELSMIDFGQVWLPWTERRGDPLADALRAEHTKEKEALAQALKIAGELAPPALATRRLHALRGAAAFLSPVAAADGTAVEVAVAMQKAAQLAKSHPAAFLMPGDVLRLPNAAKGGVADGVRAFVLGPPYDGPKLLRINPSKRTPETYEKARAEMAALGMSWAWAAAISERAPAAQDQMEGSESDAERAMPFDWKWRKDLRQAEEIAFFRDNYFDSEVTRRIDGDWLWRGAQQLALRLDNYTNNTSLALAFELPKSKRVLLFPGDAQVGNWLSWHENVYKTDDGRTLRAEDLLAKTILYKVGHHGSHNATLRQKGLELMTHPDLVAMLPVDKTAVDRLGYGEMPLKSLVEELNKRTSGRVLQLDGEWSGGAAPGNWTKGLIKARRSKAVFKPGPNNRPLYMEYTIADA